MKTKLAKDLDFGDVIRLRYSGSTEDVEVEWVEERHDGLIYWRAWSFVTGDLSDTVKPDEEIRIVE